MRPVDVTIGDPLRALLAEFRLIPPAWSRKRDLRLAWHDGEDARDLLRTAVAVGGTPQDVRDEPLVRATLRSVALVARSVLHLVPAGEDRPRQAIEAVERFAGLPRAGWADPEERQRLRDVAAAADAAAANAAAVLYATAAGVLYATAAAAGADAGAAQRAAWKKARAAHLKTLATLVRPLWPLVAAAVVRQRLAAATPDEAAHLAVYRCEAGDALTPSEQEESGVELDELLLRAGPGRGPRALDWGSKDEPDAASMEAT